MFRNWTNREESFKVGISFAYFCLDASTFRNESEFLTELGVASLCMVLVLEGFGPGKSGRLNFL